MFLTNLNQSFIGQPKWQVFWLFSEMPEFILGKWITPSEGSDNQAKALFEALVNMGLLGWSKFPSSAWHVCKA